MAPTADALEIAVQRHRDGDLHEAERLYRQILESDPENADALHLLGVIAHQGGEHEAAQDLIGRAIAARDGVADFHWNLGLVHDALKQHEAALAAFRRSLELGPGAGRWVYLGNTLFNEGRLESAMACYREASARDPENVDALINLGETTRRLGRPEEALTYCQRALAIDPHHAVAHDNQANVLCDLGRLEDAEAAFREAIRWGPGRPEAYNGLGTLLDRCHRLDEAETSFREALRLKPDFALAHNGMATIHVKRRRLDEAEMSFREALRLKPDYAEAHSNLGSLLVNSGRIDEAEASLREALRVAPDSPVTHSNLIFALDMSPGAAPEAQQEERRRWYERHGRKFAPAIGAPRNTPDPDRRLRVGYVSGDFRRHSAMQAFAPVLHRHDRQRFEVFCYSNLATLREDDVTTAVRAGSDHWRAVFDRGDDALAARIRSDGIDILVDLSGHTSGNRLLVFARKPAPIQVSAWGLATGTGLATMDYLFADPIAIPASVRPLFTEQIADLPCILTYEATKDAPPVSPSPVASGQPIVFGSLNRLAKLSDRTLDLWARVLRAVPGSRIMLKDFYLDGSGVQAHLRGRFAARGIEAERLIMLGRTLAKEHLAAYGQVDIALDPFPQNGGISTFDALFMGVPVVALLGETVPSRVTASILTGIGMPDWIARDEEEYLSIAVQRAGDIAGLARLRNEIRARLRASPAGNPELYTRAVEAAYRSLWHRWCAGQG